MKLTGTITIEQFLEMSESEVKNLNENDLAFSERELLEYFKGGPGSGRYPAGSGGQHIAGEGTSDMEHGDEEHIHTPMGNVIEPEVPKEVPKTDPEKPQLSIKRSTEKAHLITDGNKEMWIQKRWLKPDGTLTPGAQEKFDAIKTNAEKKEDWINEHTITDDHGNKEKFNVWKPSNDMGRMYFDDKSYIQASIKEQTPHGYYEMHRYAKGERPTVAFITANGEKATKMLPFATRQHLASISGYADKTYIKVGDKWMQHFNVDYENE